MTTTIISKLVASIMILSTLVSCQKEIESITSQTNSRNNQVSSNPTPKKENKKCHSSQVLDILDDAKTIISRLKADPSKLVVWNSNTGNISHEISYPFNYDLISPNGKFTIRKVSSHKFNLADYEDNKKVLNKVLEFNNIGKIKIQFSKDSKFLIISYRPVKTKNEFKALLFDLQTKKYVKSFKFIDLKHLELTNDAKFFIVGVDNGRDKKVKKISLEDNSILFEIELDRFANFSTLEVAKEVIIVNNDKKFFFYDIVNGELNFDDVFEYFYDLGPQGNNAIFVDNLKEFKIYDLETAEQRYLIKNPERMNFSNCKLEDQKVRLVCRDSANPANIALWDLESNKVKYICY